MRPVFNLPFVGDTAFWALISQAGEVKFEAYGPYQRRTYRTRTTILNPAGPLDISIPVHTGHSLQYRDVKINYDTDWDRQLFYALQTAYNSSPFFEFMQDDVIAILKKKHIFLWDFNIDIFEVIARLAGLNISIYGTTAFGPVEDGEKDYRIAIEPKLASVAREDCIIAPYSQIFSEPYNNRPFSPFLSMFDLVFNMGPETRDVLRAMTRTK